MNKIDAKEEKYTNKIIKNIIAINNIDLDDFFYLEQDLDSYEKVSLIFLLLNAADRNEYRYFLQQLLSIDKEKPTDLLRTWAKDKIDWKIHILEALCLIQAKYVIHKLGLDYVELCERFLPLNYYTTTHVHLIVKLLYYVCEQLTIRESRKLIDYMQKKYPSVRNVNYSDNGDYIELYFMHWILEKNVIDVGQTNQRSNVPECCNLEPIILWLKENEFDSLNEIVKNVTKEFNGRVQTDDKQATTVEETFASLKLPVDGSKSAYKIRKDSAGIVLIINQKNFHFDARPEFKDFLPRRRLDTRNGTDRDAEAIEQSFKCFGYNVRIKCDRLHTQILDDVQTVIDESIKYDSVIVCILSHGHKGVVYGANSVAVKIESIEKLIISDKLIGKPKILIIQACQGEETQRARDIGYLAHDGPSNTLPVFSDFLTCISTVPGFTSIRHTEHGSWFIQTLCDKIKQFAHQKHFLDILTAVTYEVLNKRGRDNECMVPIFHSTLRLGLYFPCTT
ncbi:caspase-8 [Contarinia nasturtii]|uniref:caspase-8 n=1 Tax=Contarinia nasturtii TaxID=265458 RepID=UPI0012D40C6D|nr:caspase-8 [Contarinia nasturtii]